MLVMVDIISQRTQMKLEYPVQYLLNLAKDKLAELVIPAGTIELIYSAS